MVDKNPPWLKIKPEEVEQLVLKLSKEMPIEKIGLFLRDNYGIPTTKVFDKKISEILKEHNLEFNLLSPLQKKSEKLKAHLSKNKKDERAKRALTISGAKIKKLKHYMEKSG